MPDVSGLPALDVLIGLIFLYFLLSILCSAINEAIASIFAWRAKNLERAIRNMLQDPKGETGTNLVQHFYDNPRIKAYSRKPDKPFARRRLPSYLPPRAFALAVLDTVAPTDAPAAGPAPAAIAGAPAPLKQELSTVLAGAETGAATYRKELETWFNEVMERASGWYRRKVQVALWLIAIIVVGALNADSFQTANRLWNDEALRTSVVTAAQAQVTAGQDSEAPAAEAAPGPTEEQLNKVADTVNQVEELNLPLGWSDANTPDDSEGWLTKVLGSLVTVIALSLGAPFWFDLLTNLSKLRGTGTPREAKPEDTRPQTPAAAGT